MPRGHRNACDAGAIVNHLAVVGRVVRECRVYVGGMTMLLKGAAMQRSAPLLLCALIVGHLSSHHNNGSTSTVDC